MKVVSYCVTGKPIDPSRWHAGTKRTLDLTVAAVGLLMLSPLLTAVALIVRFSSSGPILFRQTRVGRDFQPFEILKFRTMLPEASERGLLITVEQDPRITRFGRFLRRTKIDELAQLINVLKGDMSLTGPRPEVPQYVALFQNDFAEILQVRPGLTDMASIKYRHEANLLAQAEDPEREYIDHILPDKIALAKTYVANRSFFLDLTLIVKTLYKLTTENGGQQ